MLERQKGLRLTASVPHGADVLVGVQRPHEENVSCVRTVRAVRGGGAPTSSPVCRWGGRVDSSGRPLSPPPCAGQAAPPGPSQRGLCSDVSGNREPARLGIPREQGLGPGEQGETWREGTENSGSLLERAGEASEGEAVAGRQLGPRAGLTGREIQPLGQGAPGEASSGESAPAPARRWAVSGFSRSLPKSPVALVAEGRAG